MIAHNLNIVQTLSQTFNQATIQNAQQTLSAHCQDEGFLTQLLIVGTDDSQDTNIRIAALLYIKNCLKSHYNSEITLPSNDYLTIKSSILQALIRNCQNPILSANIREIIYIMAEKQFPTNWPQILSDTCQFILNSQDFQELYGSVEALKAILSAFAKEVNQKLSLENISNKITRPLFSLAPRLLQSFNQQTAKILVSIFKIFSTITYFHLSEEVFCNIHSLMVLIKKLLDLKLEADTIDNGMYELKKISLRILYRIYQRHMNRKVTHCSHKNITFFNNKYANGVVESLIFQIMNEFELNSNSTNRRYYQLTNFSLSCMSYVYNQYPPAVHTIDQYMDKIIHLSLGRYRLDLQKNYNSFEEFREKTTLNRINFSQLLASFIRNETMVEQQRMTGNYSFPNTENSTKVLSCLFDHIQNGDMEAKEVCLYLFSQIAHILPSVDEDLSGKMRFFILEYIKPLINQSQVPLLIKIRSCEVLSKYAYIEIESKDEVRELGEGVCSCLLGNGCPKNGDTQTYLQISAVEAFNGLLKYDSIIQFISPHLKDILKVYTSLLEIDVGIIKCLEDLLDKFENSLEPFSFDLVEMLFTMFFQYKEHLKKNTSHNELKNTVYTPFDKNRNEEEEESDDESGFDEDGDDQADNNYLIACKACLASVRQILQSPNIHSFPHDKINRILVEIFSDSEELYLEEGFNILNLALFKQNQLEPTYNIYFTLIVYGIIPVHQEVVGKLKDINTGASQILLSMMEAICLNPDIDFIENTVSCLRNFISKYQKGLQSQFDILGNSLLTYLFELVTFVHENQSNKSTQADRTTILTLYISLIEWRVISNDDITMVLKNIANWLNMEKESQAGKKTNNQQSTSEQLNSKTVYSPIYVQIILLSVHFYLQATLNVFNGDWILLEVLQNWNRYNCDYEISRVLVGVGDLLSSQSISDQSACTELFNRIPEMIEKQCKIRVGEDDNDIKSEGDEAEEDNVFGDDENTHMLGNKPKVTEDMEEEQSEDSEMEDEFNKYYSSPMEGVDEITYIVNALKSDNGSNYMGLMSSAHQEKLSYLVLNAPNKTN